MPASGGTYRRRVKVLQVGYAKSHQLYINYAIATQNNYKKYENFENSKLPNLPKISQISDSVY